MRYILFVTVLLRGLEIVKLFDIIMLATRAGPGNATETVSVYIYFLGFKYWSLGYAAAASFLLLIAISIITAVLVRRLAIVREA
jgi:multiple sugar transport system permease protein